MNKQQIGNLGEDAVCRILEKKGCSIIKRNYRIKGGEIDIIASCGEYIAFVEVKTRALNSISSGFDAVNDRKKKLILKTAADFMIKTSCTLQPRFDVAEVSVNCGRIVKVNYICNAFDATGYDIIF